MSKNISASIRMKDRKQNKIIVVDRLKNSDYVEVFTLADNEIGMITEQLKKMGRRGVVSKLDVSFDINVVFDSDLEGK